ncbi:hypothetical protein Tco_1207828, partial [Tanacetum coccineum]
KSTSCVSQILGRKLVCWSVKKQSSVAMSSAKAEYVDAVGCYTQVLLIKSQLADYDVLYDKVAIFYDNTSAIAISNNRVLHSRTKHIDIRYHFIRDHILKGDIELYFIPTELQLADIFNKPLDEPNFTRLVAELGCALPPKGTVRAGLATLGLADKDKPSLTSTELTPSASEVSLNSHMLKVAKLLEEHERSLLPPSREATKECVVLVVPLQSLEASILAEVQDNQPKAVDATKVPKKIVEQKEVVEEHTLELPTVKHLMDEGHIASQETPESPYDIKSEIMVVKSFLTSRLHKLQVKSVHDSDETADSQKGSNFDLQSMPDDELRSVSGFETADSNDFLNNEVSTSDHIVHNANAPAERLSFLNHIDHIYDKVSSLHLKLDDIESSIAEIKSSLPTLVNNAIKEQLPELLSTTLKDCLPLIIKEYLQTHSPASNRFVTLQKELSKVIRSGVAKKVQVVGLEDLTVGRKRPSQISRKLAYKEPTLPTSKTKVNEESTIVLYDFEEKNLVDLIAKQESEDDDDLDKQPLSKRFKIMHPIPSKPHPSVEQFTDQLFVTTTSKFSHSSPKEPTPPRDESKGKEGLLSQDKVDEQLREFKRLADLKAEKDKSEEELRKLFNQTTLKAQAQKWTKHEAKKAKMIEDYNHQISFRADPLPNTKISYVVNQHKEATIKIVRDNNPLNIIIYLNFRLKTLGFSEWLEIHALASKKTGKSNDMLLQTEEKKRKRSEFIKEVFVTEDIRINGMGRNLIPPPRVIPI